MSEFEIPRSRLARSAGRRAAPERLDAAAAMSAGLFAGTAILLMLVAFASVIYGEAPWKLLRMIAATVRGPGALAALDEFDPGLALMGGVLHFAFSVLYALALLGVVIECRRWLAPWLGLGFGIALYFVNLHGFTLLFPWFAELRTIDTLVAHGFFGLLIVQAYAAFAGEDETR